jgi:hypothetical protein
MHYDYFNCCVSCTVVVLTSYNMCEGVCFCNMYILIFFVLSLCTYLYCFVVILSCFVLYLFLSVLM